MKRKPIQLIVVPESEGMDHDSIACLCDDGTIWYRDRLWSGEWEMIDAVPQPEEQPKPMTPDHYSEAVTAFKDILDSLPCNRGWLNPYVEARAKRILKEAKNARL